MVDSSNALVAPNMASLTGTYGLCDGLNSFFPLPNTEILLLASQPITCASPVLSVLGEAMALDQPGAALNAVNVNPALWEACIVLPRTLAPVTLEVSEAQGNGMFAVTSEGGVSGGYFTIGSLSVTTVRASSMTVILSGTDDGSMYPGLTADGTYDALRCP